ncbi:MULTISPECIES: DUF87 domain-containing protein [unclassified Pseudoxanthomonas]|uniref:ATP-binding protein n=1 Tax=unclassified Pseudoxanthomonas TaxID=2645906 RepID=UPI00307D6309
MSFSKSLTEVFGRIFDTSPFTIEDPIVKVEYVSRGSNIVVGRSLKEEDYSELFFLGKVSEQCSAGKSYLNSDVYLDTTFPHVIYITGTRGSGKSFDLGVIIEGISPLANPSSIQNEVTPITSIVIDTQSQFWTLGYEPNGDIPENAVQLEQLKKWNLKPNRLANLKIFVPPGTEKFLGVEQEITIRPRDVLPEEWCSLFGQDLYGPQGHIISTSIEALQDKNFGIDDLIAHIETDANWPNTSQSSRSALLYKLEDYRRTRLFDQNGVGIEQLLTKEHCHLLMLRDLRNEDKALVTAIIARQLFSVMGKMHSKKKVATFFNKPYDGPDLPNKVWLIIDEAHVVAPCDAPSPARNALIEYVKRGRDAGLSLVLATQQPSAIDDRILSQVNLTINHRLTFQADINSATNRIPSKPVQRMKVSGQSYTDFGDMIRLLGPGNSFVSDHGTSRALMVQIRPRVTAHGGYSPI